MLAGCGGKTTTVTVTATETVTRTVTAPPPKTAARLYFLRDGKVAPVARDVTSTAPDALLAALAAGPTDQERAIGLDDGRRPAQPWRNRSTRFPNSIPKKPVEVGGKSYTRADFEG